MGTAPRVGVEVLDGAVAEAETAHRVCELTCEPDVSGWTVRVLVLVKAEAVRVRGDGAREGLQVDAELLLEIVVADGPVQAAVAARQLGLATKLASVHLANQAGKLEPHPQPSLLVEPHSMRPWASDTLEIEPEDILLCGVGTLDPCQLSAAHARDPHVATVRVRRDLMRAGVLGHFSLRVPAHLVIARDDHLASDAGPDLGLAVGYGIGHVSIELLGHHANW